MLPDKAKIVVCSIISIGLSFGMKHLVIGQLQKPANFSAFHWSTSRKLHGPSMLPDKAKILLYNQYRSIVLDETSCYWSVTKTC